MFYLNVPMSQKDKAKGFGAAFDWDKKKWYVPDDIDLEPFKEWVPMDMMEEAEMIIQSQQPEKGIKLSALLGKVKTAIEENVVGFYWVNAEIADSKMHNGNLYIQLAETTAKGKESCVSRAILFSNDREFVEEKFKAETGTNLTKGLKVLMKVKVTYTVKHQMSLKVLDIDPTFTLGGMEAKIKDLRDKITRLNLYDANKKFKMPDYFKNVAVVSPTGAAGLGDFKADADRLSESGICEFHYYTATFQGDSTAKTVSKAIKKASFDSFEKGYDAIVVIRGGGAKTDLHFLNEFDIAQQVAQAKVPVFVGVGHERDRIFLDEIAFASFDTPSKVIGFISTNNVKLAKNIIASKLEVDGFGKMLFEKVTQSINSNSELIHSMAGKVVMKYKSEIRDNQKEIKESVMKNSTNIKMKFEEQMSSIRIGSNGIKTNFIMKLDETTSEIKLLSSKNIKDLQSNLNLSYNDIKNNSQISLSNFKTKLNKSSSEIEILSPLNALYNGFAIIKNTEGKVLKTLKEVESESSFIVWMQDGEKEIKKQEK